MALRVFPILYTLFAQFDIKYQNQNIHLRMEKMSWMLTGAVSMETVFWAPRVNVKIDGSEGFSNITHPDRVIFKT